MDEKQRDETITDDAAQEAASDNVCEFPGCGRDKRPAGPGAGRPPAFCDLRDPRTGKDAHTAKTAFRERKRIERAASGDVVSEAEEEAPATFARESGAELRDRAGAMLSGALTEIRRLLERLETIGDPAAYEIEAEHAAATWEAERGQLHARAAEEAKNRRDAERKAAEADAAAEEMDTDRQAAEERSADLARQLAAAIEAHGQEIERMRADAAERETSIKEDAEHEIGIAERKADAAEARAREAQDRAETAIAEAAERVAAAGQEADRRVAETTARADETVREARAGAARQVQEAQQAAQAAERRAEVAERKAAEADQRAEDGRAEHAAEIGRLNAGWDRERATLDERARDLVQARDDARAQRERAEADVDRLRTELAEARKARRRRGDDAE
jgi:colicin import membrane protein